MKITIPGKQKYLSEEKSDINIELLDFTDISVKRLIFQLPHKCRYPQTYSFVIEYRNPLVDSMVWTEQSDVNEIFDNFDSAFNFKIEKENYKTKLIASNEWDKETKTMFLYPEYLLPNP